MAFDIATLTEMGIEPEAAEKLVCLHKEVVDGLKAEISQAQEEIDSAKAQLDHAAELQAQLDEQAEYKTKYEAEKAALESLQAEQAEKKETQRKRDEFRALAIEEGITHIAADLIAKCADVNSYRWDAEKGTFENPAAIKAEISAEWAGFKRNAR